MSEQQNDTSDQSKSNSLTLKQKIIIVVILIPVLLLWYLCVADVRNHKYAYIFQRYYLSGDVVQKIDPGYNGTIKRWWKDGTQESLMTFKDGGGHGRWAEWEPSGKILVDGMYKERERWSGTFILIPFIKKPKWQKGIIVTFKTGEPVSAKTYEGKPYSGKIVESGTILEFSDGKFIKELGTTY